MGNNIPLLSIDCNSTRPKQLATRRKQNTTREGKYYKTMGFNSCNYPPPSLSSTLVYNTGAIIMPMQVSLISSMFIEETML